MKRLLFSLLFLASSSASAQNSASTTVRVEVNAVVAPVDSILNWVPINDLLTTGGQMSYGQIPLLEEAGFDAIVSLASANAEVNGLEAHYVVKEGMMFTQVPMEGSPDRVELQQFFDALQAQSGRKVFVHCNSNRRASAFTFLYRVIVLGEDEATARKDMETIWNPDESETWRPFFDEVLEREPDN